MTVRRTIVILAVLGQLLFFTYTLYLSSNCISSSAPPRGASRSFKNDDSISNNPTPLPTTPPTTPTEPMFTNKCAPKSNTDTAVDFNPSARPPTLVVYVYAETNNLKISNFNYFLKHGLCENCFNIDYAIILNGATFYADKIPDHKNIQIVRRDNQCGDFGAWQHFFKLMGEKIKKYKRIMFLNDTVKGPYMDPNYLLLFKNLHFTDIFGAHLNNDTRLVGSYISCGDIWNSRVAFSHVQTMSFMMDDVALQMSSNIMICYEDRYEAIMKGEIGLSKNLIEKGVNIGSVMYAYRGVDFRCNDPMRLQCNNATNPSMTDHKYFGIAVSLTEVVFVKNTAPYLNKEIQQYTEWGERPGDF